MQEWEGAVTDTSGSLVCGLCARLSELKPLSSSAARAAGGEGGGGGPVSEPEPGVKAVSPLSLTPLSTLLSLSFLPSPHLFSLSYFFLTFLDGILMAWC